MTRINAVLASISFVCVALPAATSTPVISAVLDAAGNTPNLAPGSIFIVKGTALCPDGTHFFSIPRPSVAPDGVKITFTPTAGGAGADTILVYEYNPNGTCQLAGILPSGVAAADYNVTVTNGTVSAPFATRVILRKPALFTQDASGTGLAAAQNYRSPSVVDLNSFTTGAGKGTTISPARPGQFLIAYGTGLGAFAGGDNIASPSHDFNQDSGVTIRAIVGGMSLPVAYAGRAGYAGEDQINFALPANVPTGCTVPLQLSVNGTLSNATFIAIAPDANAAACVQPGFSSDQLKQLDAGGTYTVGAFTLTEESSVADTRFGHGGFSLTGITGSFTRYSGYQLSGAPQQLSGGPTDACVVTRGATSTSGNLVRLDAGAITLNGPGDSGVTNVALKEDPATNSYSAQIAAYVGPAFPGQNNGPLVAGTYSLKGAGGKDVGTFNAAFTIGAPLTVTLPLGVFRDAGLTLRWTGGNASDLVQITGSTLTSTDSASFSCNTTAGKGSFTVPAAILNQLPPSNSGSIGVFLGVNPAGGNGLFAAPLTAGGSIDAGFFTGVIGATLVAAYN